MNRSARFFALSILGVVACGTALGAGGSRSGPPPASDETPKQLAVRAFEDGLSSRDTASWIEKKAGDSALSAEQRARLEAEAEAAYRQAIESFWRAVENDPGMFRAWGGLGHAYRRVGDYEAALEAHEQALLLKPDYGEALEDLGEAYLGMGRITEAQETYGRLRDVDETLANDLLAAARRWIAERRAAPDGVQLGELDAFERWVEGRQAG